MVFCMRLPSFVPRGDDKSWQQFVFFWRSVMANATTQWPRVKKRDGKSRLRARSAPEGIERYGVRIGRVFVRIDFIKPPEQQLRFWSSEIHLESR